MHMYFTILWTRWPSGLRRQFKALVFGRGFESHSSQLNYFFFFFHLTFLLNKIYNRD